MSDAPSPIAIPDKVFFRIGEVAEITGVQAYVLRFWEKEFGALRPQKSKSGQRRYRRAEIELVLRIKELLWERKFTIAGARSELRGGKDHERTSLQGQQALPIAEPEPTVSAVDRDALLTVRQELLALRGLVRRLAQDPE